ncbi:MAG TPA: lysylphosphatidylglycerol synthase domain-containing protein, partial [Puia sp.]|nr:lysylphosphatidylglycerol synthase domain-containing protein [Puia sp.]
MLRNKNIKLILNYFLGPLVFLLLFYSIYHQILHQPNWKQSLQSIQSAITGPGQWKLWATLILMPVNWGLECRKWQLAMHPLQPIPFWKALKATFTGVTIASFTPNRIGEYFGRILYVDEGKRTRAIGLTITCSLSQFLITLIAGLAGIIYLFHAKSGSAYWGHHPIL